MNGLNTDPSCVSGPAPRGSNSGLSAGSPLVGSGGRRLGSKSGRLTSARESAPVSASIRMPAAPLARSFVIPAPALPLAPPAPRCRSTGAAARRRAPGRAAVRRTPSRRRRCRLPRPPSRPRGRNWHPEDMRGDRAVGMQSRAFARAEQRPRSPMSWTSWRCLFGEIERLIHRNLRPSVKRARRSSASRSGKIPASCAAVPAGSISSIGWA